MATDVQTTVSDPTLEDATAETVSAKSTATAPPNEEADHAAEPTSEDVIASESSSPTTPTGTGETDSSDSTTADDEARSSTTPNASEDERDGQLDEGEEDEMDALTRGFETQASISHSTYLQTDEGKVLATGPGFAIPGHYTAKKSGRVFATAQDPPGKCFNCQGNHWRKDCPFGLRF